MRAWTRGSLSRLSSYPFRAPGGGLWIPVALALWGLFGCAPEDPGSFSIADLPIIPTPQDLRIDGYEADLAPVGWVAVSPDGTLAVAQGQDHSVRFFDPQGRDLGMVGGQGGGPGEFQAITRGGWLGDTLWVSDFGLNRVTLLSTEPAFVRTLPPLAGARPKPEDEARFPPFSMAFPYAVYPGDELLIAVGGAMGEVSDPAYERLPILRATAEGVIEGVVMEPPRDDEASVSVSIEGGVASARVPFYPIPQWTVAPDGSRIGTLTTSLDGPEAGTFRVSVYDPFGEIIFSRTYPIEGIPIPGRVVDSILALRAERSPVPALKQLFETEMKDRVPPIYPPVEEIVLGVDGTTWIKLHGDADGRPWMVLDPAGEPVGRVMLPADVSLEVVGDTHIWALQKDEFDVESIIRLRLEKVR